MAVPQKYAHIDFTPPKAAQEAARRALEWRAELPPSRRGMTATGLRTARLLASGEPFPHERIVKMASYFPRHEVDKEAEGFNAGEKGFPSKGRQAWDGWGGDVGARWAARVRRQMLRAG